jgi:hypothetical protein
LRAVLSAFVVCGALVPGVASSASADAACSGEACSLLAVAADGCSFKNKGDKAVRFSLVAGGAPRVVTILAPGETFKEADKNFCVAGDAGDKRLEASFAVLGKAPTDDKDFTLKGKPSVAKPAVVATAAAPAVQVATTAPAVPLPRAKPAAPPAIPMPRAKPEVVEVAMAAPPAPATAVAPAPTVAPPPVAAVAPTAAMPPTTEAEAAATMPKAACGEGGCPPILFKVIDNCLWVMNLNPRAVAFEAEIGGKHTKLALEAADGDKADAHAAVAEVKELAALHMRLKDPFQSAGSGIPVFRARLGKPGSCVKSRAEITTFTASYVN